MGNKFLECEDILLLFIVGIFIGVGLGEWCYLKRKLKVRKLYFDKKLNIK